MPEEEKPEIKTQDNKPEDFGIWGWVKGLNQDGTTCWVPIKTK